MGFFETVFAITGVLAVFVGMPWVTFQGILKIKQANRSGTELRRSDLEAIVADAVEDATQPLRRRIESLEAIATDTDLEAGRSALDAAVLAGVLEDADDLDEPSAVRRRARS